MADAAARREARRRRILENSENRLQRISGHVNHDDSSEERKEKTAESQSTVTRSVPNGIAPCEAVMQNQSFDSLMNEINAHIDEDEPSLSSDQLYTETQELLNNFMPEQNVVLERNAEQLYTSNEYGNTVSPNSNSNNLRFLDDREESHVGSTPGTLERDAPDAPQLRQSSTLSNILSSRLVYVALAVVVNIMLLLKLEHMNGASIIIPFVMVMIGRLCIYESDDVRANNNILLAALILSNCRPDFVNVILRLKSTSVFLYKVLLDLAIYIFSFVLLYNMISHVYNRDDNFSLQHEPQAVVSDATAM